MHGSTSLVGNVVAKVRALDCRLDVAREAAKWRAAYSGPALATKVTDLDPGMSYSFRVAACNAAGEGAWSEPGQLRTPLLPPEPPAGLSALSGSAGIGRCAAQDLLLQACRSLTAQSKSSMCWLLS